MSITGHSDRPQGISQDAGLATTTRDLLNTTRAGGFRLLRFPDALETAYRQVHATHACDIISRMLPWVTLLYVAAVVVMYLGASPAAFHTWLNNALWPVLGAIAWLWIARLSGLLARDPHTHTGLALGIALFASTRTIFLLGNDAGVIYATYQVIYLLFIAFTVAHLRLAQALGWTLVVCAALLLDVTLENLDADWLAFGQYFLATVLISAVIGYMMEHRERLAWLDSEVAAMEKAEMAVLKQAADAEMQRQRVLGDYLELVTGNLTATEIAGRSLKFLIEKMGAQIGTVYLVDGQQLRRAASYALDGEGTADYIERGESLIGQAAADGRRLRLAHLPESYHPIRTATGSAAPAELLVQPVQQQGMSLAVIELGALHRFDDSTIELIERITPAMAGTLVAANAREALARAGMDEFAI